MATSVSAKAFCIGVASSQPTVDDVVRVALGQVLIEIEPNAAARLKQESPAPKAFALEAADMAASPMDLSTPSDHRLSAQQAAAVLFTRLLSLVNGRSGVRLQLCEHLVQNLNRRVLPALSVHPDAQDKQVLRMLAQSCCYGQGQRVLSATADASPDADSSMASALDQLQLSPPGLSAAERLVLEGGSAASAGLSALTVQGGKQLLSTATAVLALSCEALGAQTRAFEPEVVEAHGYTSAISIADELRGLLEGSKRTNTLKGGEEPHAFNAAPQRLGALSEALSSTYVAVRAEVQSSTLPVKGSSSQTTASSLLPARSIELARCFVSLARDALCRAERVAQGEASLLAALPAAPLTPLSVLIRQSAALPAVRDAIGAAQGRVGAAAAALMTAEEDAIPGVSIALAASGALDAAHQAVALEALVAVARLRLIEGTPVAAPAASGESPAPAAAVEAPPAATAAGGKEGKGGKKDAGKDNAGKKDRKPAGMVIGRGTAFVRAQLEAVAAAPHAFLSLSADSASLESNVRSSCSAISATLTPLSSVCTKFLNEVRSVIDANQARRKPKIPKGTRDFMPEQMAIREAAFSTISAVFKRHGAVAIDTPVFELRETLTGKYGEDSKLIYDLADQGGESLCLRYDLTVPFARFVAVHSVGNIKRYHFGKVYRRDQPAMNRGRFREFFQCDFDIAGAYAAVMVPDAEVIKVVTEIVCDLQLGAFEVKLNHRRLLDAMLKIAGVPSQPQRHRRHIRAARTRAPQKFRPICSAIDKLDKESWEVVRAEMVDDKGLDPAAADTIGTFVVLRGAPLELLPKLLAAGHPLSEDAEGRAALEELALLFEYLKAMDALQHVVLDLSLARGLDYYTGVIYEVVLLDSNVGSIAAGGRYDKLVGMFSGKDVPAVGVSVGIERVFSIMEGQMRERAAATCTPLRASETEVLVASIGNGLQPKRMELCAQLWAAGIKAEFGFKANPKMGDSLACVLESGIPFMVLFGQEELTQGVVKIKTLASKEEETVQETHLVEELKTRIAAAKLAAAQKPSVAAPVPAPVSLLPGGRQLAGVTPPWLRSQQESFRAGPDGSGGLVRHTPPSLKAAKPPDRGRN
ncbi:MAG: hypothetical protein WDW36_007652 [Sanguina aurantia]